MVNIVLPRFWALRGTAERSTCLKGRSKMRRAAVLVLSYCKQARTSLHNIPVGLNLMQ